ncbi:TBCEL [Lepeophtheirus salmonis]|uniref:TBCEL n=1 Tax=Lepeophtheirus salmonis TaxID=72036 RepID=A0A7R8H8D9_LEPSM|nr:TBCEL [Lepeophtheirus salmonis]CAF2928207.1 TBCEL [Lepeophtheirus salmonis]
MSDQRTLLKAINEKYFDDDDPGEFFGDIVFLNSSPITKNEFFPPIITLCDYGIEIVGHFGLSADKLANVTELDLTDNKLSDWSQILLILKKMNLKNLQLLLDSLSGVSSLKSLSLSDCSISEVPSKAFVLGKRLKKLRDFKHLTELRIQGCPFSDGYPTKERRMLLVARLPNIRILNGGDRIPVDERENYERSFVRYFFDTRHCERPSRWQELVNVHGNLQPLVNVDLAPKTSLSLKIVFGEQERLDLMIFRVFYINQETFEHCEKYQKSVSMPEGMRRRRRTSSSSKSFSYSPKNKETQKESPGTTPPRRKYAQVHLLSKNNNPMGTPVS